jgi:hypothetical protein
MDKRKKEKRRGTTKHTHKAKDRLTRTSQKTWGEPRYSGRVSSSCSTSDTHRASLVTNPVIIILNITACAEPPAVQNVTYTVELINSQYVVQYQCVRGLLLIGNDLPVCQHDTNWTKPTLLCTGMYELMYTLYLNQRDTIFLFELIERKIGTLKFKNKYIY